MVWRLRYVIALLSVYPILQLAGALFFYKQFSAVPHIEAAPRLPNVRLLPRTVERAAVRSFLLRTATGPKDVVLIAGDSQFYGYFLAATDTVGRFLQEELGDAKVINASRIAASTRYPLSVLKNSVGAGITPRVLVFSVNPAVAGSSASEGTDPPALQLPMALLLARGTSELFVDLAKRAIRSKRWEFDMHNPKSTPPGDGSYQVAALKEDYYPGEMSPAAEADLRELLQWTAGRVDRVVMVASPHHYEPYLMPPYSYNWDTAGIIQKYLRICREFRHAICLDMSQAFGRDRFHDVIHLNRGAHEELAHRIASALRQAGHRSETAGGAIK